MQYNRNGVQVRQSQPVRALKRITRVISIDSRDRDPTKLVKTVSFGATITATISSTTMTVSPVPTVPLPVGSTIVGTGVTSGTTITAYTSIGVYTVSPSQTVGSSTTMTVANVISASDPGDYVVYLPRPFSNVTRIRLKNAVINAPSVGAWTTNDQYVMLGLEGLNRIDETAPGGDRAGYADYSFAKILNTNQVTPSTTSANAIFYSDQSYDENVTTYNPPIGSLDRLHVTFRRHLPYNASSYPSTPLNAPIQFGTGENSLTFEIEYLDNVFEDVSSFETFLPAVAC